ncbi:MAG: 16S rRNA (cytidine(1402)-2'-O)-methyltransferase [Clostridiales bacterium]|jgi:16S rRNA (cytidine1402-2'-O)-methyltransferase|nr:16S rRNA (cytidine(1402)-2'-O)-methyltransferase [Clostridiales bacterium]
MKTNSIAIIGLSGTFKTTVGQILAKLLGWQFVDIDRRIVEQQGMSIKDIFELHGEDYFRRVESMQILDVSKCTNTVVATGGGAVLDEINMQLLNEYTIVWLDSDVQSIHDRLQCDNTRPLLHGDMMVKLHQMYRDRYQMYKRYANIHILNSEMTSLETARVTYSHIIEKKPDTPTVSGAKKTNWDSYSNSAKIDSSTLYVVATPIGNLGDITRRAVDLLHNVDYIACEDTRIVLPLFGKYNINNAKIFSCHKFNENIATTKILNILQQGGSVALISDAGTPCISDPGCTLVQAVRQAGYTVTTLPGASCVIASVSISGFGGDWAFFGFMPRTNKLAKLIVSKMQSLVVSNYVLLESPNRILDTLAYLHDNLPNAQYMVAKELTKLHEYSTVGMYKQVIDDLKTNTIATKGEYTIVVQPNYSVQVDNNDDISIEALLCDQIVKGKDVKQAIAHLTSKKYSKNELYQASLNLKKLLTVS